MVLSLSLSPTPQLIQTFSLPFHFSPVKGSIGVSEKVPTCILDRFLDFDKYKDKHKIKSFLIQLCSSAPKVKLCDKQYLLTTCKRQDNLRHPNNLSL